VPNVTYRVTDKAGAVSYPPDRRAVAGEVVDDLPADSLRWLVASGYVERVEPAPKKKAAKKRTGASSGNGSAGGGDGS